MGKTILLAWNFLFDHEVSPLRHIPDFQVRHMVLQMLGWMWAIAFSLAALVAVVGHLGLFALVLN